MKRIALLAIISFFLVIATTLSAQDMKAKQVTASSDMKIAVVTPEEFQEYAAQNIGKEVEIRGMVVHVCKHGGKKMFLVGEDPEKRVKINATEKVSVFEPEIEGSVVSVKGIIEPIEEEVIPEEEKANQDADHKNYYHVPQYAIACAEFKVIEE
jgi:RecJ-like exonuclease